MTACGTVGSRRWRAGTVNHRHIMAINDNIEAANGGGSMLLASGRIAQHRDIDNDATHCALLAPARIVALWYLLSIFSKQ